MQTNKEGKDLSISPGNLDSSLSLLTGRSVEMKTISLSRVYNWAAAITLCSELQQSHEVDYQNRIYFAMNFTHKVWQKCTEMERRWMFISNRYKVNFAVQCRYAT